MKTIPKNLYPNRLKKWLLKRGLVWETSTNRLKMIPPYELSKKSKLIDMLGRDRLVIESENDERYYATTKRTVIVDNASVICPHMTEAVLEEKDITPHRWADYQYVPILPVGKTAGFWFYYNGMLYFQDDGDYMWYGLVHKKSY